MEGLTVFDAGFDVGVGGGDEGVERCVVDRTAGFELYVAHGFSGALEEMRGVGECCALEKAYIDVRGEDVDVGEGDVAEAGIGAAVVENLTDFVAAGSHYVEPVAREGVEFVVVTS